MKTPQMTIKSDKRKKSQERSSCYQVISYLEDSVTDPGLQKKPEMAFPLIKKKKKSPLLFKCNSIEKNVFKFKNSIYYLR